MRFWLVAPVLLSVVAGSAQAQTDHFAGNERVSLHVRITLDGSDRKDLPNGVEWFAITAHRELDLVYSLVDVGMDGVPIVGGVREGAVPPEMRDLEAQLAECGENQVCLAGVMMQFAQSGQGGDVNPFEAMTGMQPGRYRNFAGDRAGTCATGTVSVSDVLQGVVIPPPNPAVAYNFTRRGQLNLSEANAPADGVCGAEVTLDLTSGAVSLRLPLGAIAVPVTMGPGAFTHESGVAFAEGNAIVELVDQNSTGSGSYVGSTDIDLGSASHNSGQVAAGLSGRLHWSLTVD